jgi:hypothetical protein
MSGDLHLREERDYDAQTGTLRSRWQVLLDGYPVTPVSDRIQVQRRLRDLAAEALELSDLLEKK